MISHFVNRRAGFTYIVVHGLPNLSEYIETARDIRADDHYNPQSRWICDFMRSDLGSALNLHLLKLTTFLREVNPSRSRVAIIAHPSLVEPINQFALAHDADHLCVFEEQTAAYRWVAPRLSAIA